MQFNAEKEMKRFEWKSTVGEVAGRKLY